MGYQGSLKAVLFRASNITAFIAGGQQLDDIQTSCANDQLVVSNPELVVVADILPFKKPTPKRNQKGSTLCLQGHHSWLVVNKQQFDVKQGKLVTASECRRCGKRKVEAL